MRVTNVTPWVQVRYSQVLLDAGVQVADDRAGLGDGLAVELQHEAQHAVRGRVLRAHVDDDALVVAPRSTLDVVPVAAGDGVDRALGRLVRPGVEVLGRRARQRARTACRS